MKRQIFFLMFFSFLLLAWGSFAITPVKSTRVTYIANSGFLVQVGDQTILFNGLFRNGMDRYVDPEELTVSLMKQGLAPFDDVDLVFVSNHQADHFDPYVATQFMLHNKHARMICPQQVINKMKIFTSDFPKISRRLIETTPMENKYDRFVLNEVEIISMHVKHPSMINEALENIAYMVTVNGVKLFHSGNSAPETLSELKGIRLSDLQIDIAFLTDYYGLSRGARITNRIVDARYNVLMHFDKYITDQTLNAFMNRSKLESKPHIFRMRNEYQDFYINDFFQENPVNEPFLTLSQR
ncbi:MAG TPA: MBL fold metallo-hydrolase [Prolixibacteraceae bacterium]|nr:MBL fold metallo-hydrolase [Prolixibacteraceae bacterium]